MSMQQWLKSGNSYCFCSLSSLLLQQTNNSDLCSSTKPPRPWVPISGMWSAREVLRFYIVLLHLQCWGGLQPVPVHAQLLICNSKACCFCCRTSLPPGSRWVPHGSGSLHGKGSAHRAVSSLVGGPTGPHFLVLTSLCNSHILLLTFIDDFLPLSMGWV